MQEEIFGPILPVIAYHSLDDAIAKIKAGEKPLSCYVFTSDAAIKNKLLTEISFGSGAVNESLMQIANSHLPFGGVGESGMGAYHGEHGFRAFSHYKSVLEKSTLIEPSLKYFPHSVKKLKWIKWIMGVS
jgi:aldehyde dehydrogenase (NAD+)